MPFAEGVNNALQLLKRKAYGFRNFARLPVACIVFARVFVMNPKNFELTAFWPQSLLANLMTVVRFVPTGLDRLLALY